MNENDFQIKLQAVLDKVKSIANIKRDIKIIEAKLPKIKLQGTLNSTSTRKELNTKLKSINPKVKIDADTIQAEKKIKKIGKQKTNTTITPKVDNTQVVSGLKQAQKETKTLWERFTNGILGINLIRMGIQEVTRAIRQAIVNVKELDAIKTNIQMVSGTSDSGVNAMMSGYNSMARDLSSTTKDVAEAANEFLRMGESVASTNELIKSSQVLSKVGMIESADAASYLISSMKGYQVSAEDSIDIVSKLTAVDLEAAVSAGGLAEAISRCSNIANNSGTSMNRLIGYAASIGEVTQESMSVVGNSLKSIYSRMNNIKIGRFIDDETGESLSDTEAVLNKLGIQLRDTQDTYRDFDDVLDDVGTRWKDFSQVEQNAISVAIAGTMQRERFIALMNNYSSALEYSEVAANSAGSALERYEVYQDSLEAKTNELTAAIESLSTSIISEELYSGIIEATTGIVEFIDKTNLLKGTLAGLVAMGVSKAIVSIGTGFITAAKSTAQLTAAMALFDKGRSIANLQSIGAACKGLSDQQLKLILSTKGLNTQQRLAILEGKGVAKAERQQTLTTLGFAAAEDKATISTFSLKGAFNSLRTVIAMNPIGVIITAVSVATMVFSGFSSAIEEVEQKAKDLGNTFGDTKSDIEAYKSQIEELHNTINDSNSSIEDVTTARQTLMSVQDELIDKFGTEKETIDLITDAINNQSEALDTLVQKKWQETKNEFNDSGFWNGIANWLQGYGTNIDRMKDEMEDVRQILSFSVNDFDSKEFLGLEQLMKERGWSYQGSLGGFVKYGNLKDVYSELLDIQTLAEDIKVPDYFLKDLTKDANKARETIENYGEVWDAYILNDRIFPDKDLADTWHEVNEAYSDYQEAFISGNQEAVDQALNTYTDLLSNVLNRSDVDESVKEYFRSMYPALQEEAEKWEFRTKILPEYDTHALNGKTKNDIMQMLQEDGMQYGEQTFNSMLKLASEYGIITGNNTEKINQLLDLLVEWGILQEGINKSADEYVADSVPSTISTSIKQIATQLEPEFSKLGEAYKEIFKLDDNGKETFNLSAVDNSMLEDIRQSFAEIKDEIGVTFDTSKLEPFFDTLTNGNSTAGQVQQAFNDLATAYLYSTDTLEQLNSETADAIALQLEELGVQNAAEIVAEALTAKTEELTVAKEYLAQTGKDLASATEEERTAFILEQIEAGNCGEALALLQLKKMLANQSTITTADDCQNILDLATAANIGIIKLQQLQTLMNMITQRDAAVQSGDSRAVSELNRAINEFSNSVINNLNLEDIDVDFGDIGGGKSGASKAGKDAGDAYINAFQKEYDHLKGLLDRGEISESQYLNRLRTLYTRYFKDRKEYLDEFKKYESEYLSGMLELHNKALSGISTLLNQKINAANEAKDTVVSALQEEKEAAADAYQAQIDDIEKEKEAIDDLIKEKNKKIDALNEEADAIQKAAETRKKNIDLQQQEFNLQKMLNQRTKSVYKEGEGFVFETDTTGIRDAREKVKEAKEAIEIDRLKNEADLIQKEIDLLEEKKDSLTEQQEALQKLMDESNKYYDNLIKQQEKMWDSMVKNMEQQKSKWEELSDIQQIAEAYSAIQQVFGELGYSVEDVLNGSESAFEDFKSKYISLISDVNSNSDFTEGLVYATGVAKENLGSFLEKTKETADGLSELGEKGSGMDSVAESMDKLSDSATTASEGTSSIATSMGELSTSTEGISDNLTSINDAITDLPEADKLDGLAAKFTNLGKAIQAVADVLGIGEEGVVSTLVSALQEISTLSLDGSGGEEGSGNSGGGIISQFKSLKAAVEDVTSAISGGRSSGSKEGDASDSSSESMSFGVNGEGADGLISAIEEIKPAADESLGGDGESSGTIPQFQELKTAVDDVTAAIGTADTEGGALSESTTLIGAIRAQYEAASETLPETTALFEELLESIMSCVDALNSMVSLMGSMSEIGGFGSPDISATPDTKDAGGNAHADGTVNNPVTTNMYPEMPLWERMEKCAAALGRTMDDMLNPLNSLALDIRKETGMGRFLESINNTSNITNNNKNVQPVVHNTFNITMPNVTDSTTATSLMNDLQSLATKKFQMDW